MTRFTKIVISTVVTLLVAFFLCAKWSRSKGAHSLLPQEWSYQYRRDRNSHTLSRQQCLSAFPGLSYPIHQAENARHLKPIQLDELEFPDGRCMVRAMIYNDEVFFLEFPMLHFSMFAHREQTPMKRLPVISMLNLSMKLFTIDTARPKDCFVLGSQERILSTLAAINRAVVSSPQAIPNIEFSFTTEDLPDVTSEKIAWGIARRRNDPNVWLMPDFGYWSWNSSLVGGPSFTEIRRRIDEINDEVHWGSKIPQAVWRGDINGSLLRRQLVRIARGHGWNNITHMDLAHINDESFLPIQEHCRFKFLMHTEGVASAARLKYLQLCSSITIAHEMDWQEFHTHLMISHGPTQNYVEIDREWKLLPQAVEYYLYHDVQAQRIADNSYKMFHQRYLTPAAISCYWRMLFDSWAKVQGFSVQPYTFDGSGNHILRGTSFKKFAANFDFGQKKPKIT